jgi:hypothetical protein
MALKFKRVETRDWATHYRGPLAIHASKHGMSLEDTLQICTEPMFFNALQAYQPFRDAILPFCPDGVAHPNHIPKKAMKDAFPNRGKIVCVVNLVNIWPTATFRTRYPDVLTAAECAFGNFEQTDDTSGNARQGWLTEHIFTFPDPVPFTSKQGLVDVPQDVREALLKQWKGSNEEK